MNIQKIIETIEPKSKTYTLKAKKRLEQLTMPHWALGKLMDLSMDLASITRSLKPKVKNKAIIVMASDHGICDEGISKYPKEVTTQMVYNFLNEGAGINALSNVSDSKVIVVDMGVANDLENIKESEKLISKKIAFGTNNFLKEKAMSIKQAKRAIEIGISIAYDLNDSVDIFGTGEMGIGNTTSAAAIASIITNKTPKEIAGLGTGINKTVLNHKIKVINDAIKKHSPDKNDSIDILSKVGGFEIAGLCGLILGAASLKKPIVIDGFITTAAALLAYNMAPFSKDYMIASHLSVEKGHKTMLEYLGLTHFLDLNLRLGEGTGASICMNLVDSAFEILTSIATFEDAQVSGPE